MIKLALRGEPRVKGKKEKKKNDVKEYLASAEIELSSVPSRLSQKSVQKVRKK